ncbi:hypothetical protein D3C78_1372860 [compost metagenome]
MGIGTGQPAEIGALAGADTGDEEGHLGLGGDTAAECQRGQRHTAIEVDREHGQLLLRTSAPSLGGGGMTLFSLVEACTVLRARPSHLRCATTSPRRRLSLCQHRQNLHPGVDSRAPPEIA